MSDECEALHCERESITAFLDGAGRLLWLCELHADALAVGFATDPPRENCEVCRDTGWDQASGRAGEPERCSSCVRSPW